MASRIVSSLVSTERLSDIFSDGSVVQAMLDFESALARAEAAANEIPAEAAEAISKAATPADFDLGELMRQALRAGTPAIPFVKMLREQVRSIDPGAAGWVHWGATSQDVVDTALVLLLGKCRDVLAADHVRIDVALERLSEEHTHTVMLGRTLLQAAPPVTFGLKAAGWLGALRRGWARVASRFDQALLLQFGGASGTLAMLGDRGVVVSRDRKSVV